ncbi:MAG TPA: PPC domain-containing protein [Flavipsychrobacter sp.]|nr:PPC domain-containing protein [Flavipsychrobacter sp.]
MTTKLNLRFLLAAIFALTAFAGCKKVDDAIDAVVTKHAMVFYRTENNPDMTNVFLGDMTIGGITLNPSYPDTKSGDVTIADNMPYTLNIETSPMTNALDFTITPHTGTIPGSMFNASQNIIDVKIDNLVPTVYVNDVKVPAGNNGGGNGGGGNGGGGSKVDTITSQLVSGDTYDKKIFRFTIPSGLKNLSVRLYESNPNTDRNTADLFVRQGSDPVINHNPPQDFSYTWIADCAGINPNRIDELCSFDNPKAGQWTVIVYGYNTYFFSRMTITTTSK